MKEFSYFLTAKSNSRKSNCVSSLLAANDLYLYLVANICIERQILAYHKNLLYVTWPSKCQLFLHASPTAQKKQTKRKKDHSLLVPGK